MRRNGLVYLRFEVRRLLHQDGGKLRVVGCVRKLQKRRRLSRQILPADHHAPHKYLRQVQRLMTKFVSTQLLKSELNGFHWNKKKPRGAGGNPVVRLYT
jgi:hypothetical protein